MRSCKSGNSSISNKQEGGSATPAQVQHHAHEVPLEHVLQRGHQDGWYSAGRRIQRVFRRAIFLPFMFLPHVVFTISTTDQIKLFLAKPGLCLVYLTHVHPFWYD